VLEPAKVLGWVDPTRIRPVPSWKSWLDHGFGFLFLGLTGLLGLNLVGSVERWSLSGNADNVVAVRRRFLIYRALVLLTALTLSGVLAYWLLRNVA